MERIFNKKRKDDFFFTNNILRYSLKLNRWLYVNVYIKALDEWKKIDFIMASLWQPADVISRRKILRDFKNLTQFQINFNLFQLHLKAKEIFPKEKKT